LNATILKKGEEMKKERRIKLTFSEGFVIGLFIGIFVMRVTAFVIYGI
jgi:hypothetical protein